MQYIGKLRTFVLHILDNFIKYFLQVFTKLLREGIKLYVCAIQPAKKRSFFYINSDMVRLSSRQDEAGPLT